jgi:polysaccharide deacetylase 2 family uncharacterized protein YibQ
MAEESDPGRGRRAGAALPLGLLALFLIVVAAAALWATLAPPPAERDTALSIPLTPGAPGTPGAPAAAESASHAPVAPAPAPAEPAPSPDAQPPPAPPPAAVAPTPAAPAEPPSDFATPSKQFQRPPPQAPAPPPAPAIRPPPIGKSGGLSVAPDPSLVQKTPLGPLPIIAPDGRRAWQVYARPFEPTDKRPRIAIMVTGLGTSDAATEAAIQGLPGGVTLAFWPYSDKLDHWIKLARAAGHEVLLNLPMEPENYPSFDPGPKTLLTSLSPRQNLERLEWALSRVTGYVGVADLQGSRFTASRRDLEPVLETLNQRGLIFVDSRSTPRSMTPEIAYQMGLPWASNSRFLDDKQISRAAIDARLRELETIARTEKRALGIGAAYPVTLERITAWVNGLNEKGLALAPVTAVLEGQPQG